MSDQRIARRRFIGLTVTATIGTVLTACAGAAPSPTAAPATPAPAAPATTAPAPTQAAKPQPTTAPAKGAATPAPTPKAPSAAPTAAAPTSYHESPALADLVKAGKLPPVEKRLPKEPYVVGPGELVSDKVLQFKPGKYGGTMRLAQESPSGDPHIFIGMNEPLLWAFDGFDYAKGIHGSVLKAYEANADDTVFTFHLREGLKWSDGEPVTIDDVKFAFEDVLNNQEITTVFPVYLRAGMSSDAAPAKLTVIDPQTFSLTFDKPYGSFPAQLAIGQWRGYVDIIKPKHYLQQFHIKYTPLEKLQPLMKEQSIPEDQWYNLFNAKQISGNLWKAVTEAGIGHPVLTPWVITKVDGDAYTYERNPYYYKVDTAGNQLPYIDGIRSQIVQDKEALTARGLMGEFDYLGERASLKKLPLMKEREDKGEIKLLIPRMHRLPIAFMLNLTFDDPNWRKVTGDVRFRKALSLAINRPEILKTFYLGQFAKLPTETNPSEFDVAGANKLLDDMGLAKKDGEGYRLGPDGKRFTIPFEIQDLSEDHLPMGELIAEYWKKVGVYTTVKKIDGTLATQRWNANELQATSVWAHSEIWRSGGWDDFLPANNWGRLWSTWYSTQGKGGEQPPEEVRKLYDLNKQFMTAKIGTEASKAAADAIFKSHRDNLWMFSVVEHSSYPTFFTKRMQNVPTGISDGLGIVTMYSMEQWYIS